MLWSTRELLVRLMNLISHSSVKTQVKHWWKNSLEKFLSRSIGKNNLCESFLDQNTPEICFFFVTIQLLIKLINAHSWRDLKWKFWVWKEAGNQEDVLLTRRKENKKCDKFKVDLFKMWTSHLFTWNLPWRRN